MRQILCAFFLILLTVPGWTHGDEEHADIREEAAHEAAVSKGSPSSSPKTSAFQYSSGKDRYIVSFTQQPAEPKLGEEVEIEANVVLLLNPPDPLLGDKITVEGATVSVSQIAPSTLPLGDAHSEAQPGTYGIHFVPDQTGSIQLEWTLQQEGREPFQFAYSFELPRPLKVTIAWAFSATVLILMLITSLIRSKIMWGGWAAALILSTLALAYAYRLEPTSEKIAPGQPAEESVEAQRGLKIPLDLQQDLEMTVESVKQAELAQTIRVPGTVRIPEGSTHSLHARFPSQILTETPRIGRRYQKGEEVARLQEVLSTSDRASLRGQSIDLQGRQLEFATRRLELQRQLTDLETQRQVAASEVTQQKLNLSRSEQLYAIQALPKKELEAARTAHNQAVTQLEGLQRQQKIVEKSPPIPELPPTITLQEYSLTAPVDGVISKVEAAQGEVVEPSKSLFTLVDMSRVWVEARVSEKDLAAARDVGRAEISTVAYPGPFVGTFVSVAPGLDPETRTALVFFQVDNQDGKLLEGMSAEVDLGGAPERVLTVPSDAIQTFDQESRLFVKIAEDRFEARTVKVIRTAGALSVISGDIKAGTPVVTKGAGALASELARRSVGAAKPSPKPEAPAAPHGDEGHSR